MPLNMRRNRGIPVPFGELKQAFVGIIRSRSFSICLDVIRASLLDALTMSWYVVSDFTFFCSAPDKRIHIWGLNECGMPALTMLLNFSVRGKTTSTLSHVNSVASLLWENSKWAIHCKRCWLSSVNGMLSNLFELGSGPSSSSTRKPNSSKR